MKARSLTENLADLMFRHAVIGDEVEADLGQRETQLGGGAIDRPRVAREIRAPGR